MVLIREIQGDDHISPLLDQQVDEVIGIVTAVDSNGFYVQDPNPDDSFRTSEGLFVFTDDAPAVAVGDEVQVAGTVSEFGFGTNLTTTQITDPTIAVLSQGNELPAPIVLGTDVALPPTGGIDDDGLTEFQPGQDAIDYIERFEGMRVTVQDARAVDATDRFGQIFVTLGDNSGDDLSDRGTLNISDGEFNSERVQIDDDSFSPESSPALDVGDSISEVTGVVGYSFGNFEILATEPFGEVTDGGLEPETTAIANSEDRLTIASFNVLNLDPVVEDVALVDDQDPGDVSDDVGNGQFEALGEQIANNLGAPDIIGLQEIQDNNGAEITDVTAADETLQLLVDAIAAAGGPTYEFIDNPFIGNETNGGQPGGNIRNAFLYNPDRVEFVPGSESAIVDPQDQQTNEDNPFFDSRLPLAATFLFNGQGVTVVSNHFSSKGGSSSLFGAIQPATELQEDPEVNGGLDERRPQAQAVNDFVDGILASNPNANVVVLGDFNEFEFISPLGILAGTEVLNEDGSVADSGEDAVLVNLTDVLVESDPDDAYSFIFEGNAQSLDHILVSNNLAGGAEFDAVHTNIEFADQASDHDPLITSVELAQQEPAFTLQLLHAADQEAGLAAIEDAVNFSAVIEGLSDDFDNTLRLSSGDIIIPGAFFNASDSLYTVPGEDGPEGAGPGYADIIINNALGFQAVTLGNHEFDLGTGVLADLIESNPDISGPGLGDAGYLGTEFPYLSANLDFSTDDNLADLVVENGQAPQPNSLSASTVIDVNGEQIGVVGATTPTLENISSPGAVTVLPSSDDIAELAAIIQAEVDALTDAGVNKIILSSHFQQLAIEQEVAALVDNVDIVIGGGSNTLLANEDDPLRAGDESEGPYPIAVDSNGEIVYVVNTDGNYQYVGQLVANFDENGVIVSIGDASGAFATDQTGVEAIHGEGAVAADFADPVIVEVTQAISDETSARDGNVFGLTEVFLNGTRGDVRTQETNLGNLTADANLEYAQFFDDTVQVSLKNGGGIRDNIGVATIPPGGTSDDLELLPPQANPVAGKEEGEISQLDIENSLRFNNGLTLLTLSYQDLEQVIEHSLAATEEGATPGQFPQVSGIQFRFDPEGTPIAFDDDGTVTTDGTRVTELAIVDESGETVAQIVEGGEFVGDPEAEVRIVTLNFLANPSEEGSGLGGDSYPFPALGEDVVQLTQTALPDGAPDAATFAGVGSEQDALAEYLNLNFPADDNPDTPAFTQADTPAEEDTRILQGSGPFTLQLLHAADQEAGLAAIEDAVNFSAVIEGLADDFENTLRLSSGDIIIPGAFFNASDSLYTVPGEDGPEGAGPGYADIIINNALGFQAVTLGNHEFDLGTGVLADLIESNPDISGPGLGDAGYLGTEFPYLSANLDFSTDDNLAGLVVENGQAPQPNSLSASTVIDVNGELIGVVGATTPTLENISSPGAVTVLPSNDDIAELAAIIQAEVDELTAAGVNKIILSSHFQQLAIEQEVAALVDNVDIVIGGGSNTLLANEDDPLRAGDESEGPYPIAVDSDGEIVYVVNTDGNYQYVGQLVVEFDESGVVTSIGDESGAFATDQVGVEAIHGEGAIAADFADPVIVEVTQAISDETSTRDGNIFGLTEVFLNGTRGDVRTQETNLGNLTADANLEYAQFFDETVQVSLKNGGGIRDNIGVATIPPGGTSDDLLLLPPQANPVADKEEGEISQLDIENSLRFNNGLTLLTLTYQELEQVIEHGVAATEEGATPGQFPQVSGISFGFDPEGTPIAFNNDGSVETDGTRVTDLAIVDESGETVAQIVENSQFVGDPDTEVRIVTLGFLAEADEEGSGLGGDSYPFPAFGEDVLDLTQTALPDGAPDAATFAGSGSEQDALAEFLVLNFPADDDPATPAFNQPDTPVLLDTRIEPALDFTPLVFGSLGDDTIDAATSDTFEGETSLLFTGAGNDDIDASTGAGGNRIYGGAGGDEILGGSGDRIFGGLGEDILDATESTSSNRLYGGLDNDDLFAGSNGRLDGGPGSDRLFIVSGGGNILSGGDGSDQFWVANAEIPAALNTIADYSTTEDAIGIAGLGLSFADLDLTEQEGNTLISAGGTDIALLNGVVPASLGEANFVFG